MNGDEIRVIFAHPLSGCGATVAHQLPKLRVAGSNPVARSNFLTPPFVTESLRHGGSSLSLSILHRALSTNSSERPASSQLRPTRGEPSCSPAVALSRCSALGGCGAQREVFVSIPTLVISASSVPAILSTYPASCVGPLPIYL